LITGLTRYRKNNKRLRENEVHITLIPDENKTIQSVERCAYAGAKDYGVE
jgi:hypothetical protein